MELKHGRVDEYHIHAVVQRLGRCGFPVADTITNSQEE